MSNADKSRRTRAPHSWSEYLKRQFSADFMSPAHNDESLAEKYNVKPKTIRTYASELGIRRAIARPKVAVERAPRAPKTDTTATPVADGRAAEKRRARAAAAKTPRPVLPKTERQATQIEGRIPVLVYDSFRERYDTRRVRPQNLDRFLETHPGARVLKNA